MRLIYILYIYLKNKFCCDYFFIIIFLISSVDAIHAIPDCSNLEGDLHLFER